MLDLRGSTSGMLCRALTRRSVLCNALQTPVFCTAANLIAQTESRAGSDKTAGRTRSYADGRPAAILRLNADDSGPLLRHGEGPARCDYLGAREAICFQSGGMYYLHYDGAGPTGWRACLAISRDLRKWDLRGPVLDLGQPGEDDAGTASSPWTVFDGKWWHMFYVGSRSTTPAPNRIPAVPYFTLAAKSLHPYGPWKKQPHVVPFRTKPGTYYADTASPGQIVKQGAEYLMFFSAAAFTDTPKKRLLRTLSIARTKDLDGDGRLIPGRRCLQNSRLRTPLCISSRPIGPGFSSPTTSVWMGKASTPKASGSIGAGT